MSAERPTLAGVSLVTLAPNLPGPLAVARLRRLGAAVTKIEPPSGDGLSRSSPGWYALLHEGCTVLQLDLKAPDERRKLDALLGEAQLLITSSRPSALARLQLGWDELHARHPHLSQVAIVGELPPNEELAGHDLTYVATLGLVEPPAMPRTLIADIAGSERAVAAALELLLRTASGLQAGLRLVSLREAAQAYIAPLEHGMTRSDGILGGAFAGYRLYRVRDGWIAIAALEPHFWSGVLRALAIREEDEDPHAALERAFLERTVSEWEEWALELDLPISGVRSEVEPSPALVSRAHHPPPGRHV